MQGVAYFLPFSRIIGEPKLDNTLGLVQIARGTGDAQGPTTAYLHIDSHSRLTWVSCSPHVSNSQ